jgi:hypothetical protein
MGLFKKRLGESPIPGDGRVTLPAGKVIINYEEDRNGRSTDTDSGAFWPGIPDGLVVTVVPAAGGDALPIDRPRAIHEYATIHQIGTRYGQIEVAVAGDYTFTVAPFAADRELFTPHLMLKG